MHNYSVSYSRIKTAASNSSSRLSLEQKLVQLRSAQKGIHSPAGPTPASTYVQENDSIYVQEKYALRARENITQASEPSRDVSKTEVGITTPKSVQSFLRKPNFSDVTPQSFLEKSKFAGEGPQSVQSLLEKPKPGLRQRKRPVPTRSAKLSPGVKINVKDNSLSAKSAMRSVIGSISVDTGTNRKLSEDFQHENMAASLIQDIKLTNDITAARVRLTSPRPNRRTPTTVTPRGGAQTLQSEAKDRDEDGSKVKIRNLSEIADSNNKINGERVMRNTDLLLSVTSTPRENIKKILQIENSEPSFGKSINKVASPDVEIPDQGMKTKSNTNYQLVMDVNPPADFVISNGKELFSYTSSILAIMRMVWFLFSIGLAVLFAVICTDSRIEIRVSRGSFVLPN
mmetsp:Transcript_5915/g.7451  ORF Transcript_5915/g.7451 Transcript_5915/m.7451 type:complete len:399 (+) Transcript_5915:139-1335(+)